MDPLQIRRRLGLPAAGLALAWGCFVGGARAQDAPVSRLAVVGDADRVLVGQEGYCGTRNDIEGADRLRIALKGGQRVWLRLTSRLANRRCFGEISFEPKPYKDYIVRFIDQPAVCQVELFRIRPGEDPVREALTREEGRSCLLP